MRRSGVRIPLPPEYSLLPRVPCAPLTVNDQCKFCFVIDPKRLRDEIEIYDAIERHKAQQRSDKIWAVGLLILVLHGLAHYWIFVRPKRLAALTPAQIQFRRKLWWTIAACGIAALYVVGLVT